MNLAKEHRWLRDQLKQKADPQQAAGAKRYLKSPYKFYGVDTLTKRNIVKQWFKDHPQVSVQAVVKLAEKLWDSLWHDEKTFSILLLQKINKKLSLKNINLIEKMINQATGWDHIDEISLRLISQLIDNDPQTITYLPKWSKSKNFWVRRVSLLSQIPQFRRQQGDLNLFFKLARPMFNEGKDWDAVECFFIRKAIGWTLREIAQKQPLIVFEFVKKHKNKMSGLTYREAARKLPAKMQKELASI